MILILALKFSLYKILGNYVNDVYYNTYIYINIPYYVTLIAKALK